MKLTLQFYSSLRNLPAILYLLLFFTAFFLAVPVSEASWPTELYTGKPLVVDTTADEEAVAVAQAPDGTLRLLTRTWWDEGTPFYFGLEYTLYALDREGNLLWPREQEHSYMIEEALDHNDYYPVVMKVGSNGETWIVWESYVFSEKEWPSELPLNNSIRAVRFDADGNASPFEFAAVEQGQTGERQTPNDFIILSDGGMILFWHSWPTTGYTTDQIPRELRVQRYSSAGEEQWEAGGKLLGSDATDDFLGYSFRLFPDGVDGVVFNHGNQINRLNSNGDFRWEKGSIVNDSLLAWTWAGFYDIGEGRAIVLGKRAADQRYLWISAIDTSGIFVHGFGTPVPYQITYATLENVPEYSKNNYFIFARGLVRFTSDCELIDQDGLLTLWENGDRESYIFKHSVNRAGIRYSLHEAEQGHLYINEHHVLAYDTSGVLIWDCEVGPEDDTYPYRTVPWLAPDGTTFIFWSESGLKEGKRDIYANVVNLAGDWGVLETTSVPDRLITALPNDIALRAWPNPFNASVSIRYRADSRQSLTLTIYDLTGRQVHQVVLTPSAAETQYTWRPYSSLASGIYFATLVSGETQTLRKLVYLQ